MTKKRADRDVKSVAFSLVDAYESQLYAHALTKGKFSAYVKRLIDRDMGTSSPQTPPTPFYAPPPSIPSPEPQTPPTPFPEPPVTQAVTKPFIVPKAASGFNGMY